jgi:arginase
MSRKLNLFFPQWQGSGNSLDLYTGANLIFKYLKSRISFLKIPVSLNKDIEVKNNIFGYDIILYQLNEAMKFLKEQNPNKIFSLGGGCGIEIPIVSYLNDKYSDIFWFDAHGDLNTPSTSPSHCFHGMPLRYLIGDIEKDNISKLVDNIIIENLFMIGTRDLDFEEIKYINEKKIKTISVSQVNTIEENFKKSSKHAYIHIDLDVLDPNEYSNVKCPAKNGLYVNKLCELVELINNNYNVVGYSILESIENNLSNLKKIDRLFEFGINI